MHRTSRIVLLGSLSCFVNGCSIPPVPSDNPFQGVFKITSHTRNDTDCNGVGVSVTNGDKFIKLNEETQFNTRILAYRSCTEATVCSPDVNIVKSFLNDGKSWMQQVKGATSRDGNKCFLQLIEAPLVKTDLGFTLDRKSYERTITLGNGEACQPDIVESHRSALICFTREVMTAEKQ